jgi:hypothetical protein
VTLKFLISIFVENYEISFFSNKKNQLLHYEEKGCSFLVRTVQNVAQLHEDTFTSKPQKKPEHPSIHPSSL